MKVQDVAKLKLPNAPGVYFFKERGKILYLGKAASLRDRVRSYFAADLIESRGPRIVEMVAKAGSIGFKRTGSVLEAFLLEANLIKRYQPPYNIEGKDDKSYNCVIITDEAFPQILVVRQHHLNRILHTSGLACQAIFGPFPYDSELKEAMKIIRRIFPHRDGCCESGAGRPCFSRQVGLCPGVCTGEVSKREYSRTIGHIRMLFEGKKTGLLRSLARDMHSYAVREEFEQAAAVKRSLFALRHINDIALIKKEKRFFAGSLAEERTNPQRPFRIEAFDVAHFAGSSTVGVMTVVEDGLATKSEYRTFRVKSVAKGSDIAALKEILRRRLGHEEWRLPDMIVVDGGTAQKNAASAVVKSILAPLDDIPVVSVIKDKHHRPRKILGEWCVIVGREMDILRANKESHRFALSFHRKVRAVSSFRFSPL